MSRHATNAVYKAGTFNGAPTGVTFSVSTITLTDGDVATGGDIGRYVVVSNGAAARCHREIVAVDTTNNMITVNAPFGMSAFRGLTNSVTGARFTEATPADQDNFVLSYDILRVASGDETFDNNSSLIGSTADFANNSSDMFTLFDDNHVRFNEETNGSRLEWFVFGLSAFHLRNGILEWSQEFGVGSNASFRNGIQIYGDSTFIFGDINFGDLSDPDVIGYPENSCFILDRSRTFSLEATAARDQGHQIFYGGNYNVIGDTTFLRGYRGDGVGDANQWFRMIDVDIQGNFGSRITGDNSIVLNGSATGYRLDSTAGNNIGYFNPLRPGLLQGMTFRNSEQVLYNFPDVAGSTNVPSLDVQDIGGTALARVVRANNSDQNSVTSMTLTDWSITDLRNIVDGTDTRLYHVDGATAVNHQFRLDKTVNFSTTIIGRDGSVLSGDAAYRIVPTVDSDGITTISGTLTGNSLSQVLRAWDFNARDTIADFNDADAVNRTPWGYVFKVRNQTLQSGSNDLTGPSGAIEIPLTLLPDLNITELNTSTVDGYSSVQSTARAYDYADRWKFDNPTLPTLSAVPFLRNGNILNTAYDITLAATVAVEPISFASNIFTLHCGSGRSFDGGLNLTTAGSTLNLGGLEITDDVSATTFINPRIFSSIPTDRTSGFSFGGTLRGIGGTAATLTVDADDVPAGETQYLLLTQTTGHNVTINIADNAGNLVILGPTEGVFANDPGGITLNSADVTAGRLRFEPAPAYSATLDLARLPADSIVDVWIGDVVNQNGPIVRQTNNNTITLTEAAGFSEGTTVIVMYSSASAIPQGYNRIVLGAAGTSYPVIPTRSELDAITAANTSSPNLTGKSISWAGDISLATGTTDSTGGSDEAPSYAVDGYHLTSNSTAQEAIIGLTQPRGQQSALLSARSRLGELTSETPDSGVVDLVRITSGTSAFVHPDLRIIHPLQEDDGQQILNGTQRAADANFAPNSDFNAGRLLRTQVESGFRQVVGGANTVQVTVQGSGASPTQVAAIVNGATGANVDTSGNNSGATILPILFTKN